MRYCTDISANKYTNHIVEWKKCMLKNILNSAFCVSFHMCARMSVSAHAINLSYCKNLHLIAECNFFSLDSRFLTHCQRSKCARTFVCITSVLIVINVLCSNICGATAILFNWHPSLYSPVAYYCALICLYAGCLAMWEGRVAFCYF